MKLMSYVITIISSVIIWLAVFYATVVLGWLVFCWQCGAEESGSIWLFWPLVYLLTLAGCYLLSKLENKYGGGNFLLSLGVLLVLGFLHASGLMD